MLAPEVTPAVVGSYLRMRREINRNATSQNPPDMYRDVNCYSGDHPGEKKREKKTCLFCDHLFVWGSSLMILRGKTITGLTFEPFRYCFTARLFWISEVRLFMDAG